MKFSMGDSGSHNSLLVIVAMDIEEQAIVDVLGSFEERVVNAELAVHAKVFVKNGKQLILAKSGIGIANASSTTALILSQSRVDGVLLFGVAGAITEQLAIGDLVVATSVIQHDSLYSGENGFELMAPGCLFVTAALSEIESPIFKMDQAFRDWFRSEFVGHGKTHFEGALLSGSEFVGSGHRKRELAQQHPGALAVEMESAGIAVVTKKAKVPFCVLKTIADRLNPDESVFHDFNLFVKSASENAADVIRILWENWTQSK